MSGLGRQSSWEQGDAKGPSPWVVVICAFNSWSTSCACYIVTTPNRRPPAPFGASLGPRYYSLWEIVNFDECLLNFAGCGVHCLALNNIYHGLFSARGKTKHVLIPKWTYTAVFIVRSLSIKNGKAPLQHILWHMPVIDPIYWLFARNVCIFRKPKELCALQTWFIAPAFKWRTLILCHAELRLCALEEKNGRGTYKLLKFQESSVSAVWYYVIFAQ